MLKTPTVIGATPINVVVIAMDTHFAGALERAGLDLVREMPGLNLALHAASEWSATPRALERCRADIARADIIVCGMLFMEDHFLPILDALRARREACDALVCALSAKEVVRLTRLGRFTMEGGSGGALAFLRKFKPKTTGAGGGAGGGSRQMAMLRRLPRLLRLIPGTAQDVRAYLLTLQYWLGGSQENLGNMVRMLVGRYADGPRRALRESVAAAPPVGYPDVGVYHPRLAARVADDAHVLAEVSLPGESVGTVGLLVMRSYLLAANTAHYDGVIAAMEARGLRVIPAFSSGLDARPAIAAFFQRDGRPTIDALVSLTGFSLVGGPAYNDAAAAETVLADLDVPYLAAHPAEFQTLEEWGGSDRGLTPVEATIMVAIPEIDGATGPLVFGGRSTGDGGTCRGCERACSFPTGERRRAMHACAERADMLAGRVAKLVALRRSTRATRKVGIVLFNFPPNAGNTGTAAYLSVFESLHRTLLAMKAEGYTVDVPADVDALRERVVVGNAAIHGAMANVHARISVDVHVRRERHLREIEAQWGAAPGRQGSDGRSILVLGERFGNVFVGIQPSMGYEGDPMRLLFERGFAPTHAFSAFYRWIREDFAADAVLHFGTHGALEFMPGKQSGLSGRDWPDRLIGDLPNLYLYAANNPSEGAIAKRRAAATLISYLTPPIAHSGLYRGLADLKATIGQYRSLAPDAREQRADLAALIQAQAAAVELAAAEPAWGVAAEGRVAALGAAVLELEYTLIPHGLHAVGQPPSPDERAEQLVAVADASHGLRLPRAATEALVRGDTIAAAIAAAGLAADLAAAPATVAAFEALRSLDAMLARDTEIPAILHALDGGFTRPAPGGDLLRTPAILPTGRNLHGFDPFKLPSASACRDGARQAERLLARHVAGGNPLPETIAMVLWGTDNLKSEGAPLAQVLALLGAAPRFDGYGRLAGATLIPLAELGRPRVDVVVTMSGIFRDLLPLQIRLIAEACFLAASADEPVAWNFVRKHALAHQAEHGCDLATAALRVFGNADGAYGSNVNNLLESGRWEDGDELAETYTRRKSFAYGRDGRPVAHGALLRSVLCGVDLAYQNLDSVELGVTSVDTYFDTLGGISRAVRRAKDGVAAPVYIGDQTRGEGTVRTLSEQVSLETRTRILNPKWTEGMLKHGYEGVRQIETHVTNTVGWSATTGEVAPWVYQKITETYLLDPVMRDRLASLNPTAAAKVADRLMEAHARNFWTPDDATLAALQRAGEDLEDRLEGIIEPTVEMAA